MQPHPKVPGSEQVLAVSCAAHGLLLAAHAQGLGAVWRTGDFAYDPYLAKALGLTGDEQILGFIYVGTPEGTLRTPPELEPQQFVTVKVIARGISDKPRLPERITRSREVVAEHNERRVYFGPQFGWKMTPVIPRLALFETPAEGPLIVEEYDTTTVVRPGWRAHLDDWNNIVLESQKINRRGSHDGPKPVHT